MGGRNVQQSYSKTYLLNQNHFVANVVNDYFNQRLRVDDYRGSVEDLIKELVEISEKHSFTKIIVKSHKKDLPIFLAHQFQLEGIIEKYFSGDDMYFMTKFLSEKRRKTNSWINEDQIIHDIYNKTRNIKLNEPSKEIMIRRANDEDVEKLSNLYQKVFTIYPTPLNNPQYILKTMESGTIYYIAEHKEEIISAASAEVNDQFHNAEITDCATLPEYRKHKLMKILILDIEKELLENNIYCVYSIARAQSYGMNRVLYQLNYKYSGRMKNNCYIFDDIENMNLWCKDLSNYCAEFSAKG